MLSWFDMFSPAFSGWFPICPFWFSKFQATAWCALGPWIRKRRRPGLEGFFPSFFPRRGGVFVEEKRDLYKSLEIMFAFFWKRSILEYPKRNNLGYLAYNYTLYAEIDCFGNFGPGSIAWDHDERLWWSSRTRPKASVDSQASEDSGLDIQKHIADFKAPHITPPCCLSIFFELTALLRQIKLSLHYLFVFEHDELIIAPEKYLERFLEKKYQFICLSIFLYP